MLIGAHPQSRHAAIGHQISLTYGRAPCPKNSGSSNFLLAGAPTPPLADTVIKPPDHAGCRTLTA